MPASFVALTPPLPELALVRNVRDSVNILTDPNLARTCAELRELSRDHAVLAHRVSRAEARNILAQESFSDIVAISRMDIMSAENAAKTLLSATSSKKRQAAGKIIIMAIPKKFLRGDRIRHDDIGDLLLDMARSGAISSWGIPRAWIYASVDGRTFASRKNRTFRKDQYTTEQVAWPKY